MNIPMKWLKQYVDIPVSLHAYTEKMSMIGHMLDKTTHTETDTVIDLELRGNRADCYSIIGIARETHACYGGRFDIPSPEYPLPAARSSYADFTINVTSPVVKRFYSCLISGLKVTSSPEWMQTRLKDYGMEPINNIVDVTNYVMIETGMPLHAFDRKRISDDTLILRAAQKGERCQTFDGGVLTLSPEDVVFAGKNNEIYGLVGVVGSKDSGIHPDTTDILLECAGYDFSTIRKTMMRHGIQTEAGLRHAHDLHESLCTYALERAASLLCEIAGSSKKPSIQAVHDYYPHKAKPVSILYNPYEVERLCGLSIPVDDQITILHKLDMKVMKRKKKDQELLEIHPPLYRTDVNIKEDIVEEVVRIWGYEHIPVHTLSSEIPAPIIMPEIECEEQSRDILTALGMNEIVSVPFVHAHAFESVHDPEKDQVIALLNPPTSNHTHLRTRMLYEHLNIASTMIKRGDQKVSFFEVGNVYEKKRQAKGFPYAEHRRVEGMYIDTATADHFFILKGLLEVYFHTFSLSDVSYKKTNKFPYSVGAEIMQQNRILGHFGMVKQAIVHELYGIEQSVYVFSLSVEDLVKADKETQSYLPYSQYPPVKMDMSLDVSLNQPAGEITSWIVHTYKKLVRHVEICDVWEKEGMRSLLVRVTYQSKERTLEQSEVQTLHTKIVQDIMKRFNVRVRGMEK